MLVRRLLLVLCGYMLAVGLVLTAIMLLPGLMSQLDTPDDGWNERVNRVLRPVPGLWLVLLPTALMLTILIGVARLSLGGEIRQWRAAGASVWPFARATGLFSVLVAGLMSGPLWLWTQPEAAIQDLQPVVPPLLTDPNGEVWALPTPAYLSFHEMETAPRSDNGQSPQTESTLPVRGERVSLFSRDNPGRILTGSIEQSYPADGLLLADVQISAPAQITGVDASVQDLGTVMLGLIPSPTAAAAAAAVTPGLARDAPAPAALAYRLSYPLLVTGLALLILPLALSLDGTRWTLLKIAAGCLLALNVLFVLLITDAMVHAGFWAESWFFPLRGMFALGLGLLVLTLFEERAA